MMFIGLLWLVAVLLLVRWVFPPGGGRAIHGATPHLEDEVRRLRDEVDQLSGQVQRLLDEQSYLLGLLEGGDTPRALNRTDAPTQGAPAISPADTSDQKSTH